MSDWTGIGNGALGEGHSKEDITRNVFLSAVEKRVPDIQKGMAVLLGQRFYIGDAPEGGLPALYKFHEEICSKKSVAEVETPTIKAEIVDEDIYEVTVMGFPPELIRVDDLILILRLAADCFCDILPLGSVVELEKEFLSKAFDVEKIDSIKFVVTQRFAHEESMETYYTYGAVAYPFGSLLAERLLYFTPPLIGKVLHRGYSDAQEDAFVGVVKNELIVKRGLLSAGFAGGAPLPE